MENKLNEATQVTNIICRIMLNVYRFVKEVKAYILILLSKLIHRLSHC
jgi:hypothetical protein